MSSGFVPGVEIFREFASPVSVATTQLPVYCFGPGADVYPYVAGAINDGHLGAYVADPDTEVDGSPFNIWSYPEKRVGGEVDLNSVRMFVTRGLWRYFQDTSHNAVKKTRNTIRLPDYILKTANGYIASSGVSTRQVQIGDPVQIRALVNSGATDYVLNTYITDLIPDMAAAAIAAAVAGSANAVDNVAAPTSSVTSLNSGITTTAEITNYNGSKAARLSETYTITALTTTADNSVTGATFKVVSADGKDNVASGTLDGSGWLNVGARGARLRFAAGGAGTNIDAGDVWTFVVHSEYTAPTVTKSGTYTGTQDLTYIVEVIEGGTYAQSPRIRVSTVNGQDQSGPHDVVEDAADVSEIIDIGNYGVQVKFTMADGLVTGDRWTIVATAPKAERLRTIAVAHSLSDLVLVDDTDMEIEVDFHVRRDAEIPRQLGVTELWTPRVNDVILTGGLTLAFDDITKTSGADLEMPLVTLDDSSTLDSQIEISYRVWHPQSSTLLSLSGDGSIETALEGPTSVDNPLKLAVAYARGEAAGPPIYFFCTGNPDVDANWEEALRVVEQTRAVYGLVPATQRKAILDMVHQHCVDRSTPLLKLQRRCWLSPDLSNDLDITGDVATLLATITDDTDTAGTQYTLVTFNNGHIDLLAEGVRPGDILRYGYGVNNFGDITYSTAIIDSVVNGDTLKIKTGIEFAEPIARKVEIHRTLVGTELAAVWKTAAAAYGEKACLLAPTYENGGVTIPGYTMCAAMAARRSAYRPHQPITNTDVTGITGLPWESRFNVTELNDIAAAGIWLFKQDPATATITVRHAITCGDYANILLREESVQSNSDSILFRIDDQLKPLYGKLNANDAFINKVRTELQALTNAMLSEGVNSVYGSQIVTMDTSNVRVAVSEKDTILVDVVVEVPAPANRIRVFMFVQ